MILDWGSRSRIFLDGRDYLTLSPKGLSNSNPGYKEEDYDETNKWNSCGRGTPLHLRISASQVSCF